MIPLATKTTLSYERCARLQQKLADLDQFNRDALPEYVRASLKALEDAKAQLTKQIDVYLHKGEYNYDPDTEYETIKTIIETCPEFLATKNSFGSIPLHLLVDEGPAAIFAPLMARVGLQYGVGGDDTRGGILVKNENGWNSLQLCTTNKDNIETLNALKAMDPPMFHKADICDHNLLQESVRESCLEMVEYYVKMDPSAMFHSNEKYAIPLQYCGTKKRNAETDEDYAKKKQKKLAIFKFLLHESMSYRPHDETIGGLFAKSNEEIEEGEENGQTKTVLELMLSTHGADNTWEAIRSALSSFEDMMPIHHKVIKHVPKQWNHVCSMFPWSIQVRDDQGRLPIHVAIETGNIQWSQELVLLIMTSKLNLNELDPVTGWPPFALAASGKSCDLSTIFFLLQLHPELVEPYCKKSRKRKLVR